MNNREFSKNLEERTQKFFENVIELLRNIPKNSVNNVISNQLTRSGGSVPANYIEANEALSRKDFFYRIRICRKESKESKFWLRGLLKANPSFEEKISPLSNEAYEFVLIFSKIIESSA